MKSILLAVLLVWTTLPAQTELIAQENPAVVPLVSDTGKEKASLDKHIRPILAALQLGDAVKEARVNNVLAEYLKSLDAWHATNDTQIKPLWNQFNQARGKQNEAEADVMLGKIDDVYAAFKPQHDQLIADLSAVLSPGQIETVEDVLTINKVKITFHAYGEIFHGLTDEQDAFILKNLKAARERAIDAGSMTEKSAFFKKYKIKIEAYLTAQGYDVKQSYRDFVAKQKAEAAAKQADKTTEPEP